MSVKKTNKQQLIETTAKLFMVSGYHNTSISDIAKACNLRKASVYHYIASKQDLCLEVITTTRNHFVEKLFSVVYDEKLTPQQRFSIFFDRLLHIYQDSAKGCLMGTLGLEVSGVIPELENAVRGFFDECLATLTALFSHFVEKTEAKYLAEDVLAEIQGAIMLGKIYSKQSGLKRIRHKIAKQLSINDVFTEQPTIAVKEDEVETTTA